MVFLTDLVRKYRSSGVVVDTNILLLYFVGSFNRNLISRFKRTVQFTPEDHDTLVRILASFNRVLTTPNILSEVNSLSAQLGEPSRTQYFRKFASGIALLSEHYVESAAAARDDHFPRLGLTDSVILHFAKAKYLVLTDDLTLTWCLEAAGVDVLNFNHIRVLGWR